MTAASSRRRRGAATQRAAAAWFAAHGFPHCTDTGAGRSGRDLLGLIGLACEVKARRDWNPLAWIRQARATAGDDLPFVIARPDGAGEATVADWPVVLRLEDFTALVRAAGYGDPTPTPEVTP